MRPMRDVLRGSHRAAISALREKGSRSQDDADGKHASFSQAPCILQQNLRRSAAPYQRHPETCTLKTSIGVADVVQRM